MTLATFQKKARKDARKMNRNKLKRCSQRSDRGCCTAHTLQLLTWRHLQTQKTGARHGSGEAPCRALGCCQCREPAASWGTDALPACSAALHRWEPRALVLTSRTLLLWEAGHPYSHHLPSIRDVTRLVSRAGAEAGRCRAFWTLQPLSYCS